jgi:hypothetical protein
MSELKGAVPQHLQEITPDVSRLSLEPYSSGDRLFPTHTTREAFVIATWKKWAAMSIADWSHRTPKIFVMDFGGINHLDPDAAVEGFAFVFANFRGQHRLAYATYQDLTEEPLQSLRQAAASGRRTPTTLVGNIQGDPTLRLLGDQHRVDRYQSAFDRLNAEPGWVHGHHFAVEKLHHPNTKLLNEMSQQGLILKQSEPDGINYYRKLTP